MWAEGGLWSSVEDLSRWLSFQFREDGAGRQGSQILAGETVKEMHKARYLGDDAWTAAFCISWYAARKDEVIWIQHAGGLNGFITNICFNPKERVGAIVLLNGIADAAVLSLELAAIARDAVREAAIAIEPAAPMPPAYRDLLGMYVDEEQAMIARLEWRRGAPDRRPDEEAWRPTLVPTEDPDVFVISPGVRESGERVTFSRRADGRVTSMFLAVATMIRFGPVGPD